MGEWSKQRGWQYCNRSEWRYPAYGHSWASSAWGRRQRTKPRFVASVNSKYPDQSSDEGLPCPVGAGLSARGPTKSCLVCSDSSANASNVCVSRGWRWICGSKVERYFPGSVIFRRCGHNIPECSIYNRVELNAIPLIIPSVTHRFSKPTVWLATFGASIHSHSPSQMPAKSPPPRAVSMAQPSSTDDERK